MPTDQNDAGRMDLRNRPRCDTCHGRGTLCWWRSLIAAAVRKRDREIIARIQSFKAGLSKDATNRRPEFVIDDLTDFLKQKPRPTRAKGGGKR